MILFSRLDHLQIKQSQSLTRKWAEDHEVQNCMACGKGFSVTVRKVRHDARGRRTNPHRSPSLPPSHFHSLALCRHLAPLPALRQHLLRRVLGQERPDAVLQEASAGVRDVLRRAPRLSPAPSHQPLSHCPSPLFMFYLPQSSSHPQHPQQAEESLSLSYFSVHYKRTDPARSSHPPLHQEGGFWGRAGDEGGGVLA